MMYKQSDVIGKLDSLLDFSIQQHPKFQAEYTNFINEMRTALNDYFTADRTGWKIQLTELQYLLYSDLMKRRTKYSKKNIKLPTNFPESYNDTRKCFADFSCIMDITNADFLNGWIIETVTPDPSNPDAEISGDGDPNISDPAYPESDELKYHVAGNSYITTWLNYLSGRIDIELNNIIALCSWMENAGTDAGVFMLYEDMGEVIEAPTTNEIAQSIFIDRHFKECIDVLNLPTHTPTWL